MFLANPLARVGSSNVNCVILFGTVHKRSANLTTIWCILTTSFFGSAIKPRRDICCSIGGKESAHILPESSPPSFLLHSPMFLSYLKLLPSLSWSQASWIIFETSSSSKTRRDKTYHSCVFVDESCYYLCPFEILKRRVFASRWKIEYLLGSDWPINHTRKTLVKIKSDYENKIRFLCHYICSLI